MDITFRRTLLSLTVVAVGALAQDTNLAGPVSGFLVDEQSRSIRPVLGMPGSAYAGDASVTAFDFASGAPDGRSAVISRSGSLHLIRRLDRATPVWRELVSEPATISGAAWSENSESLAVVSSSANRLEIWTNLSDDPRHDTSIDISSLTEPIVAVAVDREARYAFAATQGTDGGALYLLTAGEAPRMILPLNRAGGLLVSASSLYVIDRGRNEVLRVTDWASNPTVASVASAGHGVNDPVGAALSLDLKTLYVASAGVNQVLGLDLASGAVKATFDLDFSPTRLERMGSGNLLLLERGIPGERPAQVLDSTEQRVYFIPISAISGE